MIEFGREDHLHHPEHARLSKYYAAAALQQGERHLAWHHAQLAVDGGCSTTELAEVLIATARHSLGRASQAAGREQKAAAHFDRAVSAARLSSEVRRRAAARLDQVKADLTAAVKAASTLRRGGTLPSVLKAPAWLAGLVDGVLASTDVHDSADACLADELTLADDRIRFLMLLADRFLARGDRMSAVHFLNSAREHLDGADEALRAELIRKLVATGSADTAVDLLVGRAMAVSTGEGEDPAFSTALQAAYKRMRSVGTSSMEHGHDLLLSHLGERTEVLRPAADGRKRVLVEIGTTREEVPGQGSTRKLADFCRQQGLHFITVDMDPHNSRSARALFSKLGYPFEAISMKGEEFLRGYAGALDFVFLDAYDFDHGMHSELRQSRYEKYLGARIDEEACHQMHLECAESVLAKLSPQGVLCFDDTWLEDGHWTAKGATAMPFLLAHGFKVIEARNRAALLVRDTARIE